MSKKNGLADPTRLKPFDSGDEQLLRVVIETPKGSRNKFAFDPKEHIFELKKVLPAGMTFPYDFGFVPSTEADDGDPVDVLVLMDEPAFAGCGAAPSVALATLGLAVATEGPSYAALEARSM